MIEKHHKNNGNGECGNHLKNIRIEKLIKNQIFFIKKVTRKKKEKSVEEKKLYQDLESLKTFNKNFLNNFGFSFVNINSNVDAQFNAILGHIENQTDINFVKYSTQIRNDVDTFINKLESNHLFMQNTFRKIEMICNSFYY